MLIVQDDGYIHPFGTKYLSGKLLVEKIKRDGYDYIAYHQTLGLAGLALTRLAEENNLGCKIYCNATSKGLNKYQYNCFGADLEIRRIAAKPHMTRIIKDECAEHNGYMIPFGLNHPLVFNSITERALSYKYNPFMVVTVLGSGLLNRALQVAFPKAEFFGVSVSKPRDFGRCNYIEHPTKFETPIDTSNIPFDTIPFYDAKAWSIAEFFENLFPDKEILFWNVAGEERLNLIEPPNIDISLDWGEKKTIKLEKEENE